MKASTGILHSLVIFLLVGASTQMAFARPDRNKGINYSLTSHKMSPKQFSKGYQAEKRENARLFEKSRRKMMKKHNGWGFFRFLSENHWEANPTRFQ